MFRHSEVEKAHTDAVMSIVMAADCIYTASRDKTLKRPGFKDWLPCFAVELSCGSLQDAFDDFS